MTMCNSSDSLMTLPTECLLHIVDMVGDDIATLRTLLTVNSFYFHASLPRLVEVVPYLTLMHQFTPPPGHNEHKPSTWAYAQQICQNTTVWEAAQKEPPYSNAVYSKFSRMLLYHSSEHITEMRPNISSLRRYLPVVEKMAALTKLEYQLLSTLPEEHVQDLVLFIRKHRAAFPQKPPLEIVDLENGRLERRDESEDQLHLYHNHTIQVYEALVRPRTMDASFFPEFYTRCQHIDVSHLRELTDKFISSTFFRRQTPKDNADMLEMFKKAVRLTKFSYSITDIGIFSKVNAGGSTETLPSLQSLDLTAPSGCSLIHVLNDSMRAFGRTLQTVSTKIVHHNKYTLVLDQHSDAHTLGGWNLPAIRHIEVNFDWTLRVHLGAFDQCPLLTTLRIGYPAAGFSDMTMPSSWIPNLLSFRAPVWNLPYLKEMTMQGSIALFFNYDSLFKMPNLETLFLSTFIQYDESVVAPLLPSHMQDLSELYLLDEASRSDDGSTIGQEDGSESDSGAWPADWELPKLRSLQLRGFPSTVFSFDWLRHCPKLAYVQLDRTEKANRRLSLYRKLSKGQRNTSRVKAGAIPDSTQQGPYVDLYGSPLKSLVLSGSWVMSDSDICEMLTNYAPNLETFYVHRLCTGLKKAGSRFFQALQDADRIHASRGRQSKLTDIRTDYMLKRSERLRLGLVSLDLSLSRTYEMEGYRSVRLVNNCVVRHEDWVTMKK
ncbi:hypothetical protein BG000_008007 [Podila horticola]|nr:hypothetical protein BG000_008007 [Podila horticola]